MTEQVKRLKFKLSVKESENSDFVVRMRLRQKTLVDKIDIAYLKEIISYAFHDPDVKYISFEEGKKSHIYHVEFAAAFENLQLDLDRNFKNSFGPKADKSLKEDGGIADFEVLMPHKMLLDAENTVVKDYLSSTSLGPFNIKANNDSIKINVTPAVSFAEKRLYLKLDTSFPYQKNRVNIQIDANHKNTPALGCQNILGRYKPEDISVDHKESTTYGMGVEAEPSMAPSIPIKLKADYSNTKEAAHSNPLAYATFQIDKGMSIIYEVDQKCKHVMLNFEHLFYFDIDDKNNGINLKDIGLNITINFTKHGIVKDSSFSTVYFLRLDQSPLGKINVGAMMGQPQCGKSTFIHAFKEAFADHIDDIPKTMALKKHNIQLRNRNGLGQYFSLFDTCGYYFSTTDQSLKPHDFAMLKRFLAGLPEGTNFSKKTDDNPVLTANLDSTNKITHLVFVFNARIFYVPPPSTPAAKLKNEKPKGGWNFFLWGKDEEKEEAESLINKTKLKTAQILVRESQQLLAKNINLKPSENINAHLALVISHMDMIPEPDRDKFKKEFENTFLEVNENRIFYGGKECEWNQAEITAYEEKIDKMLSDRVGENQDYTEVLNQQQLNQLHVPRKMCINTSKGCAHKFTEGTITSYYKILEMFGVHT